MESTSFYFYFLLKADAQMQGNVSAELQKISKFIKCKKVTTPLFLRSSFEV